MDMDYQKELYEPIKNSKIYDLHEIILSHDEPNEVINSKEIIKGCSLVVAEVSYPSVEVENELAWAGEYGVPIICIHKKGTEVSASLSAVAKMILEYENFGDLIKQSSKYLK
jgi:hypothetical protein